MSNLITESIIVYRKLEQVYKESIYQNLTTPTDQLKSILLELLDAKSKEYFLRKENSVYDTKYYYVKTRIKNPESFYEKLVRKELGIKLTNSLSLLVPGEDVVNAKKAEVVSTIQKLDDIIGIRIVTELKEDCNSVYNLLRNSTDFFIERQIQFFNLETQPEPMKNGLPIYKLKGVFQNLYGFELQIKSKIDETWGDLDHTLFYKDYSISPIKDTVQITMNNVGILLDKIEALLFDLRESGDTYNHNADRLQIQIELENELAPLLKAKFGVNYNVKEISFYLQYFRVHLNLGEKKLADLSFDHLDFSSENELITHYIQIRNNSLVLTVLETVYVNWLALAGTITIAGNFDEVMNGYLSVISSFIAKDVNVVAERFLTKLKEFIIYDCSSDIFLSPKQYLEIAKVTNRIKEILTDKFDTEGVPEEDREQMSNEILLLFEIDFFRGKSIEYLDILRAKDYNIDDILIMVKDQTNNLSNEVDTTVNLVSVSILEKITG